VWDLLDNGDIDRGSSGGPKNGAFRDSSHCYKVETRILKRFRIIEEIWENSTADDPRKEDEGDEDKKVNNGASLVGVNVGLPKAVGPRQGNYSGSVALLLFALPSTTSFPYCAQTTN